LVLTVAVSFAIVCTPLPVGVASTLTVPPVLRLIVEPIAELTVVVAGAAAAANGKTITITPRVAQLAPRLCCIFLFHTFFDISALIFYFYSFTLIMFLVKHNHLCLYNVFD
jgi:hypothetical protein